MRNPISGLGSLSSVAWIKQKQYVQARSSSMCPGWVFMKKTGIKLSVKTPYVQQVSARDVSMASGSGRSWHSKNFCIPR